jgi:hypothetical protein
MEGAKNKKKIEPNQSTQKETDSGFKHYLPNRKTILSKLKAKKRYSHKHFQKQKSQENGKKVKSKLMQTKEGASSKEIPKNESVKNNKDSIAQFYLQERKKLNIWTFLFQKLYTSFNQILKMCEIERKLEFCKGIEETLENFLKETQKVSHWLKVEEEKKNKKSTAWEIRTSKKTTTLNDINRIDDRKIDLQFDDRGQVEFKLLNELVSGGKMSFYEAIVLIIRERAALYDLFADNISEREFLNDENEGSLVSRGSLVHHSGILSKLYFNKFLEFLKFL